MFYDQLKMLDNSPHAYKVTQPSGNVVEEVQNGIKVARGVANRPWKMQGKQYANTADIIESMVDYMLTVTGSHLSVDDVLNYGCWCQIGK